MLSNLSLQSFKYDNDEKWFEIGLKCTCIPSVNSQYGINTYSGSVYKAEYVIKFENEMKDQLAYANPKKYCPWITPQETYGTKWNFIMCYSFWKRDVTNCIKSPEDTLFRSLGVDDSHVLESYQCKSFIKGSDWEYIFIRVWVSRFNWNYFNV